MNKPFKETVRQRTNRDPQFRNELLTEAIRAINCGDAVLAKALILECIWEETNDE